MKKFFFIFNVAAPLYLIGCAPQQAKLEEPVSAEAKEVDPLEEAALPIADVLEEGFCYDDIYGSYLQSRYLSSHEQEVYRYKSQRSRTDHRRRLKNRSLFYARHTLVGPSTSYFGALPVVANDQVEFWMRYFQTRGKNTFMQWLVRAESFRDVVAPVLAQEGLPPELFFLAMVESGFSNTAYSRSRATGTWQFMAPTARIYNLKINHWVDERRDPVKATVAAARYLRDLYSQFGDWYLAMASYNAGPGTVRRAIRRTKSRDFWTISKTQYLRSETKHYVPKVLAALKLAQNMKRNGFAVKKDPANTLPSFAVSVDRPINLKEAANKLGVPQNTLKKWNPEIIRDITPPPRGNHSYPLRLSERLALKWEEVKDKLSQLEVTDVLMHKIRPGDTLYGIARKYKVSLSKIRSINPRLRASALRIGRNIAVPIPGVVTKKTSAKSQPPKKELG